MTRSSERSHSPGNDAAAMPRTALPSSMNTTPAIDQPCTFPGLGWVAGGSSASHWSRVLARALACSQQDASCFLEHVLDNGHRQAFGWMVKQLSPCDQELRPCLHRRPDRARCYAALELECPLKDRAQALDIGLDVGKATRRSGMARPRAGGGGLQRQHPDPSQNRLQACQHSVGWRDRRTP
jgi:hypothetical protein